MRYIFGFILLLFISCDTTVQPEVMKFGDPKINEHLKRIVYSAKFKPAKQKGIPVSVRYALPFSTEW